MLLSHPQRLFLKTRLLPFISVVLLWSTLLLVWLPQPAWAHRPHDVVTQIKLSPAYSQDQTAYTLARGNLFKSTDGGDHWQRLVQGLDNLHPFSTLSVDAQSGQVLAVATRGNGVYRSDDRGQSWAQVNQGLDSLDIGVVYVSPADPSLMLAAGAEGKLYRTADSGKTWTQTLDASHKVMALADADGQLFVGEASGQLLRSGDRGQTWQSLAAVKDKVTALEAAVNYTSDPTLYVGTESTGIFALNTDTQAFTNLNQSLIDLRIQDIKTVSGNPDELILSSWDRGILISTNRGEVWTDYPEGLVKDKMADDDGVTHFSEIALSNRFQEDETAFVGGFNGLYKSTDQGHTWRELETLSKGTVISMDVSPNYGDDGTLAISTYVGKIMLSKDQGETWQLAMEGVDIPRLTGNFATPYQDPRRFFDIAFSTNYANDQTLFTTTLWTKFLRSTNQGHSWALHSLDQEARGLTLLISPSFETDKTLFIGNQKGIVFRSTDGGKRFKEVAKLPWSRGNDSPSMAISPAFASDQTLYVIAESGVYKSTDAGQNWEPTTTEQPLAELGSLQIVISPDYDRDQTLFVGSSSGLFKSPDAGVTWQTVAIAGLDPAYSLVEGVALSPNYGQDGTLLVSLRGQGLFKSRDLGQTFKPIGDAQLAFARMLNVPCAGRPIQFSPNYAEDNTIFGFGSATTDVFRSTDGGETWTVLTTPDIEASTTLGVAKSLRIATEIYRRRLIVLGVLGALAAAGYVWFRRIPFERMGARQVRLIICVVGVVAALGWVAFERLVAPEQSAENGFFICLGFAALAWLLTSPWFARRFVVDTTAESLGAIRIITCVTLVIMTMWMEDLPSSALLPVEIRHSMGIMDAFYGIPGFEAFTRSQTSLQLFEWLTAGLLLLGTIGLKTRWVLPLGAFCYLVLGGILRQYTWFYHTGLLPVYLLVVLSLTPCNDGLSLDRWLKQRHGEPVPVADQPKPIYGWSRYLCWLILAASYVQAGLSKIYYSGFDWWVADNLKSKLLSTTLEPLQTNWEVSLHLVNAPNIIFALLGLVGLYGELAYGLVLFSRWARWIMPALMASVHIGILFLQNIIFLDLILVQLIFYDYTEIRRWLNKRGWLRMRSRLSNLSSGPSTGQRPKRSFFYPIVTSVLIVSMSFIWFKHREYYPLTTLQMFSGENNTGIIGYNKLIAHYESGESAQIFPDEIIYAPMNTRYRGTFRDCHSDQSAKQNKCNKLLEALGTVHNQKVAAGSRIESFEVEAWEWNYKAQPNDEDYGELKTKHSLKVLSPQAVRTAE
ncbi:MAG: YCF48-related protein [Cyanobacteria bacterium J06635_1]